MEDTGVAFTRNVCFVSSDATSCTSPPEPTCESMQKRSIVVAATVAPPVVSGNSNSGSNDVDSSSSCSSNEEKPYNVGYVRKSKNTTEPFFEVQNGRSKGFQQQQPAAATISSSAVRS